MNFTRALWLAGSRRGYNADVSDDSSFSSGEEVEEKDGDFNSRNSSDSDKSICGTSSSSDDASLLPLQFYKNVRPRHRRQRRCQSKGDHDDYNDSPRRSKPTSSHHQNEEHPDIDLSLVSLLTSKEHDRKQMKKLQRALQLHRRRRYAFSLHNVAAAQGSIITGALRNTVIEDESSSSSSSSSSSYSSSEGSDSKTYCNSITKTEQEYKKALSSSSSSRSNNNRPLAVIDYGSVQFGQLGSVLDSIYKIGVENKNKVVGGGDESCCNSSSRRRRRNFDEILFLDGRRRSSSNEETTASSTITNNFDTTCRQPQQRPPSAMMTVAGSRSSEVSAVIASLKNPTANNTMKRKMNHDVDEDRTTDGVKKLKLASSRRPDPESSSSRGRLLSLEDAVAFSPYARVLFTAEFPHTVVHVNAAYGTLVKKGLASPCALGRPMTTANGIGNSSSSSTHQEMSTLKEETVSKIITNHLGISKESISYHLFPVISDDKSFCNFVRSYQRHDYSTHPFLKNEFRKTEEHEDRCSAKHSHVSHYLLQIEPVAQFTNQLIGCNQT